jgi:hypothetical protein
MNRERIKIEAENLFEERYNKLYNNIMIIEQAEKYKLLQEITKIK